MEWDVLEHVHHEKSNDWYASVIVIAGVLVAAELYYGSFVLIALTVVAAVAILVVSSKPPRTIRVSVGGSGVRAGGVFYPYSTLDAFAVIEHHTEHKILLESVKPYLPLIVVPIAQDVPLEELRNLLAKSLPEKELNEPFAHIVAEYLGF